MYFLSFYYFVTEYTIIVSSLIKYDILVQGIYILILL